MNLARNSAAVLKWPSSVTLPPWNALVAVGMCPAIGVDRLNDPFVPFGGTGIQQRDCAERGAQAIAIDPPSGAQGACKQSGRSRVLLPLDRVAGCGPGCPPAVQNGDRIVAEASQHPPQSGSYRTVCRVVNDHLMLVADTADPEHVGEVTPVGQRMPSRAGSESAEIILHIEKQSPGDMGNIVFATALAQVGEIPPRIDDPQGRALESIGELVDAD